MIGSIVAALVLVGVYLAAGGSSYTPAKTADPCKPRAVARPAGPARRSPSSSRSRPSTAPPVSSGSAARRLARALATPEAREQLHRALRHQRRELAKAIRAGLLRAVDDAEEAGALSPLIGTPLRRTIESIPLDQAIELVNDASSALGGLQTLLGPAGSFLEGFLP